MGIPDFEEIEKRLEEYRRLTKEYSGISSFLVAYKDLRTLLEHVKECQKEAQRLREIARDASISIKKNLRCACGCTYAQAAKEPCCCGWLPVSEILDEAGANVFGTAAEDDPDTWHSLAHFLMGENMKLKEELARIRKTESPKS